MAKSDSSEPGDTRASATVPVRILAAVDRFIEDGTAAKTAVATGKVSLSPEVLSSVAAVEGKKSYRDGLLIQLAFGLEAGSGFDHTMRATGGRWAAAAVGVGFAERHIPAVKDAYQNIAKNQPNLVRGNEPAFDLLLMWMNGEPPAQRQVLFDYIAACAATTARPVLSMPRLRIAALTFANVAGLIDELLKTPSGGAHEQFAVAAFLDAVLHEFGAGGFAAGLRVETKNINASDASARTAADVQIMRAGRIEEVFEVSANNWRSKVAQAVAAAKQGDVTRAHIIAAAEGDDQDLADLAGIDREVSVTDVRTFLRVIVSVLRAPHREYALQQFYILLDQKQPNTELTNEFVRLLGRLQLADVSAAGDVIANRHA
jgi:hypothetical protein